MWKLFIRNKLVEIVNAIPTISKIILIVIGIFTAHFLGLMLVGLATHSVIDMASHTAGEFVLRFFIKEYPDNFSFPVYLCAMHGFGSVMALIAIVTALIGVQSTRWIASNIDLAKQGEKVPLKSWK